MKRFHTVIVGAGPAGLACATLLARHGKEVLVLERNSQLGKKVCAGGIPSATLALGVPADLMERSFTSQRIRSNWQRIRISDQAPMVCTVNRQRLGKWMAEKAQQAGVELRTGTPVLALAEKKVCTRAGEFGYDFLVGADGSGSLVRRWLGIPTRRCGIGIHFQMPGEFAEMEWHLDATLFGEGYGWIFPHQGSASIGAYAGLAGRRPHQLLAGLRQWASRLAIPLPEQPRAALVNHDYRGHRFKNRFLVGDAAGLASGLTGEGIYSALLSGEEAALAILDENHDGAALKELIRKQHRHGRILDLAGGFRIGGKLITEFLLTALRAGLLSDRRTGNGPAPACDLGRAAAGIGTHVARL